MVEIINCGSINATSVEHAVNKLEETKTYDKDTALAYFMLNLDVFISGEVSESILKGLIEKFEILYSKPCFEFWILLHKEGRELSCHKNDFIDKIKHLTSPEIRKQLTSHDNERQMMSDKKILESGLELMEKNTKKAMIISEELLNLEDMNFKQMNKHNYKKILKSNLNITNIHTMLQEIESIAR